VEDLSSSVAAEKNPKTRRVIIIRTESTVTIAMLLSLSRGFDFWLFEALGSCIDFVFITRKIDLALRDKLLENFGQN